MLAITSPRKDFSERGICLISRRDNDRVVIVVIVWSRLKRATPRVCPYMPGTAKAKSGKIF
jgi:hypothetical protein